MRTKQITLPIYEQRVLFIDHFEEHDAVNKFIKKETGIDTDIDAEDAGATILVKVSPDKGEHCVTVIVCNAETRQETLELLAHELFHATATLCEYLGMDVSEDSGQEAGAYIQGWLFKILYKHVLERKK